MTRASAPINAVFLWVPTLFLETKRLVGCRIYELAAAATANLRDGRLHIASEVAKGRKERGVRLPPAIYEELRAISGPVFVFEAFPAQLRKAYFARGWDRWAEMVDARFKPIRLKKWMEREKRQYLKKKPVASHCCDGS